MLVSNSYSRILRNVIMNKVSNNKLFYLLYDGDEENKDATEETETTETETDQEGSQGDKGKRTFSQEEVNKMLATDRRKGEERTKKIIGELEALKKSKNLTEQQQQDLAKRIEELNDQLLTKEQLANKDKEKLKKDYTQQVETVTKERDTWRGRFEKALIVNAIHKASEELEAFDTSQIIALIQAQSPRVVQEMDENGELLDIFTPRVKMVDFDSKQDKQIILDLTITEAIKRMKENPVNFNLFKSTVSGGLGLSAGTGKGDSDSPPLNDPVAYRKWRSKHLKIK